MQIILGSFFPKVGRRPRIGKNNKEKRGNWRKKAQISSLVISSLKVMSCLLPPFSQTHESKVSGVGVGRTWPEYWCRVSRVNKSNQQIKQTYHNKIWCHHLIAIESIPWIVHLLCNKTGPVQSKSRSRSSQVQVQSTPVPSQVNTQLHFVLIWASKHYFWLRFMRARDREEMVDHSMAVMLYMPKNDTMIWWHETPGSRRVVSRSR